MNQTDFLAALERPTEIDTERVWQCLEEPGLSIDTIAMRTGLSIVSVSSIVTLLELRGCVRCIGGMVYEKRETA